MARGHACDAAPVEGSVLTEMKYVKSDRNPNKEYLENTDAFTRKFNFATNEYCTYDLYHGESTSIKIANVLHIFRGKCGRNFAE